MSNQIELRFLRSPVALVGRGDGAVTGLRVVRNELVNGRAVATGDTEVIPCGLVVRSIGYRGRPLPGVPFDHERGVIRNTAGRVTGDDGHPLPGEYAAGWIKRGPSGVIGTNKKDAADTCRVLLEDAAAGRLNCAPAAGGATIAALLRARVPGLVDWEGWRAIDAHETDRGWALGRPRTKLVRVPEMLAVAQGARVETTNRNGASDAQAVDVVGPPAATADRRR
jgi:ferredoxin--NADP+ reductase